MAYRVTFIYHGACERYTVDAEDEFKAIRKAEHYLVNLDYIDYEVEEIE